MTYPVITVSPDAPIQEIARILTEHRISGVPVVDNNAKLAGIITEADLLLKEAGPEGIPKLALFIPHLMREKTEQLRRYEGKVARDIMTREVITAAEETPVRKLAALLARNRINRIPILRGDIVVGIVSRNDILKAFNQPDERLRQQVLDLLRDDLWIRPESLEIRVKDGLVTIRGEVARKSEVMLIADFVRGLDGVIDVGVSDLAYSIDDRA
jgi:CBS-domain-containing membrane protein